jgi:hypothetical protein
MREKGTAMDNGFSGERTTRGAELRRRIKNAMKPGREWTLGATDPFALVGDIVNHDVVADLVRRRVENPAGVEA